MRYQKPELTKGGLSLAIVTAGNGDRGDKSSNVCLDQGQGPQSRYTGGAYEIDE